MLQPQEIVNQRYQLERQLGQNAGRETWLAKDLQKEHELVVVKLLAFGGNVQWEDLKLFEREASVLKALAHPCIPKYRDYFSIDDRTLWFGLVQEYIQGDSLREYIAKGHKFTEAQVKKIAIAILEILIYLHELSPQVLHRDIKPSNLILTESEGEDPTIYLVDFGAVQDRASAEGKSFTVVGTYGYAPMEQYGGRAVAASDLYALGATLIYLLTGVSPADLPQDDDARIVFSDRTGITPHFLQWIQKLVEPTVKKRYASARSALQALSEPLSITPVPSQPLDPIRASQINPAAFTAQGSDVGRLRTQSSRSPRKYHYPPEDSNIQVSESTTSLKIIIPPRILKLIWTWLVVGLIAALVSPAFLGIWNYAIQLNDLRFYVFYALILILSLGLLLGSTCRFLETVTLEITEQETWFMKSIFGKTSWQIKVPTSSFSGVEPEWKQLHKRRLVLISYLIWAASEHNEDNSRKANVIFWLQEKQYTLANGEIRPTEVNWLVEVIQDFLHSLRRR
jgi:serine/threonine protein kinase